MPHMKPEVKQLLVEALRSGHYQKGDGYLRSQDSETGQVCYCVLGVLTELAVEAGVDVPQQLYSHRQLLEGEPQTDRVLTLYYDTHTQSGSAAAVPTQVRAWAELEFWMATDLMHRNDNMASFEEVIAYLERNF